MDNKVSEIVIGITVKHIERKFIGKIIKDLYKLFNRANNSNLKELYPFGIESNIEQLIHF